MIYFHPLFLIFVQQHLTHTHFFSFFLYFNFNLQGGKASRIVNCVLAIKSYDEWKQSGGIGVWKFGGSIKPPSLPKSLSFVRKNSEPFMNSLSRTSSINNNEKSPSETDSNKLVSLFNCPQLLVLSSEAECLSVFLFSVQFRFIEHTCSRCSIRQKA